MHEPGFEPGRPLTACTDCGMKAPIRARGCVMCDLLGIKPKLPRGHRGGGRKSDEPEIVPRGRRGRRDNS